MIVLNFDYLHNTAIRSSWDRQHVCKKHTYVLTHWKKNKNEKVDLEYNPGTQKELEYQLIPSEGNAPLKSQLLDNMG